MKTLEERVIPFLDSRAVDTRKFDNVPVYEGEFEEVLPPASGQCFPGAWYRKYVSSVDDWRGIEGVVTLGEFIPDEARFNLDGRMRYMDNPSVYIGGCADLESDCGLGYNTMYADSDTSYEHDYSTPKLGWRPFYRYIYKDATDDNGNVLRRNINSWNITNPKATCYYYFPGDKIRMKVYSPLNDYLQFRIEVIEPTKIEKYVKLREKYNLPDNRPSDYYSPIFSSSGQGYKKAEFKRVNSVDQYGNEGFMAKLTDSSVSKSVWSETYLYREINGKLYKVPFTEERATSLICPSEDAITVKKINEIGGEEITLHPGVVKAKILAEQKK